MLKCIIKETKNTGVLYLHASLISRKRLIPYGDKGCSINCRMIMGSAVNLSILEGQCTANGQLVRTDEGCSESFEITIGLGQGCNLSPYLFNLYINNFCKLLEKIDMDAVKLNGHTNYKLIESLVKPILLYSAEIWGGFNHKLKPVNSILNNVLNNMSSPAFQKQQYSQ